jgi:hypothetical protein
VRHVQEAFNAAVCHFFLLSDFLFS